MNDKTFQHSGIVVIIHNICRIISIQGDRADTSFFPCCSVSADKPSPVVEHIHLLLTRLRAQLIPWWNFHHKFDLEDILVLTHFSSWCLALKKLVTLAKFKGLIFGWMSSKE